MNAQRKAQNARFADAPWMGKYTDDITICGLGGIGSWTALLMDRAGFSLTLIDMDVVEEHNLGGQFYATNSIGKKKIYAVKDLCAYMSGVSNILTMDRCIDELFTMTTDIVIACFDNMKARKAAFESWERRQSKLLFIDGRMSAEGFQIYTVKPGEEEEYRKTLFDDKDVSDAPCSFRATSHTGAIIGGYITTIVTNYVTNWVTKSNSREVPKRIELQLPLLMHL